MFKAVEKSKNAILEGKFPIMPVCVLTRGRTSSMQCNLRFVTAADRCDSPRPPQFVNHQPESCLVTRATPLRYNCIIDA